MTQISAAIITFNEESNILRCLDSLEGVVDEMVVVDSYSTDRTVELAKSRGARVLSHIFEGHIEQKNFALSQCQFDYILSLDADEALSPELKNSLLQRKSSLKEEGYYFNRCTRYINYWVRHCGWYPDQKLRLVKKGAAHWTGKNPHDYLELKSAQKGVFLGGDLLHYSYHSLSGHVQQTDKFTSIAAKGVVARGEKSSFFFSVVLRPSFTFVRDYFFKLGFLDGRYGFMICWMNAFSVFLKYSKIRELWRERK